MYVYLLICFSSHFSVFFILPDEQRVRSKDHNQCSVNFSLWKIEVKIFECEIAVTPTRMLKVGTVNFSLNVDKKTNREDSFC